MSHIQNIPKQRDIPQEVCFKLSNAKRDPVKRNQWWFNLPHNFLSRSQKESTIGIRLAYIHSPPIRVAFDLILGMDPKDSDVIPDEVVTVRMYRDLDTDKKLRDLLVLFNKSSHDKLNKYIITRPNTAFTHDGFWIHTEYVPSNISYDIHNPEWDGEAHEKECRIVFDTDASYHPNDN
jgi:hypothetical protein